MPSVLMQGRVISTLLWLTCLLVVPGCPDKKAASGPVAGDAGLIAVDAGRGEGAGSPPLPPPSMLEPDAGRTGSETSAVDAGRADAGPQAAAPVKPPTLVPSDAIDHEDSEQALLNDYAEALQWNVGDEPLDSFWKAVEHLKVGDHQFTLVHLAKHTELRGGQQQWLLVRKHRKGEPVAYSPLITQHPFTPDHWQQVKPIGMALQPLEKSSSRVLWVRLREKISQSENGGEHIKEKERQLAYAFLVDDRGTFKALALQIPEKVTLLVDDEVTAETTLEVSIPSADRLKVQPGPTGADPEQQGWLGEHALTR